jgi:ADP-heptose:LPS heptosyltransferase
MRAIDQTVRRILLVTLDNLGDLVFASALTPPLLSRWPGATIDVWCKRYTADVAQLIPAIGRVIAAEPFWSHSPGQPRGAIAPFVRAVAAARREAYDVAILASAPWRAAAAVAATGIPVRIGRARRRNAAFLTHRLPAENPLRPVLDELATLLIPLGGAESGGLRYRLDPRPIDDRRREITSRIARPFAALHPFAGSRDRCVPVRVWLDVATALRDRGLEVLWIGTPDELGEFRRSHVHPFAHFLDHLGDGGLATAAAALSSAAVYVGHDSGPLHVAGAFGVPVVGVFAPGEPRRTFPQGVGPSRMIARATPTEIDAETILLEVSALQLSPASAT